MTLIVRTGLLFVPTFDEEASLLIRQQLRQTVAGVQILHEKSAADQRHWLEELLRRWCDETELDLILTIGGTFPAPGPSAAHCVPAATLAVLERLLPGLPEEMRAQAREYSMLALLDRGVAGIRGRTLLINLPEGATAANLFLSAVSELIGPILAHLQERAAAPRLADDLAAPEAESLEPASTTEPETEPTKPHKLDPTEFAAFLQRKQA